MPSSPEQIFEALVPERLEDPGVAVGRMYRAAPRGLTVNGKMFAFLQADRLVVKLPADRVDELSGSGVGKAHDPGAGKVQREWLEVDARAGRRWPSLVKEAQVFVASTTRPRGAKR